MKPFALILLVGLAACSGRFAPFVAEETTLPPNAFGGSNFNVDVAAVNLAQYAFADSGRTYGRPIEAARASAAMIYIAGQLYQSPRWSNISAITKEQLLQGRTEVRDALGVPAGVPSQLALNGLVAAANALAASDRPAAVAALNGPAFPAGGEAELTRLSNMPYLRMANVSTMRAANELFDSSSDERF